MVKRPNMSRRRFLQACCAGATSTTLVSTFASLASSTALASSANDYRALVCILLAGGNDSFNMLVPNEDATYAEYQTARTDLALERNALLGINPSGVDTRAYGLHPQMPRIKALFDSQRAAFLANVGTMVEQYNGVAPDYNATNLPLGLYSHADQIGQWQTGLPDARSIEGWGGRMSDLLRTLNNSPHASMGYSIDSSSVYLAGTQTSGYTISNQAEAPNIDFYRDDGWELPRVLTRTMDNQLAQLYGNAITQTLASRTREVIDSNIAFSEAIDQAPEFTTEFAEDQFSQSMRAITKTIAARELLGMKRQSFFVTIGGWDNHDELLLNHTRLLGWLDSGIGSFQEAMAEIGTEQMVTTFTTSDFARTLTSNGRGSDHGWGGNHIVVGGAVNGGQIFGEYPSLSLNNNPLHHDTFRGNYLPTTSTDEYFGEIATWFGVSASDLSYVLPNVGRFYSPDSGLPIGFLSA
ncbi:MAG: DUF1501 domain-containing protein [Pseudomonadota bacterium]